MELKVKLQKPLYKKQEEKRKWNRKNSGNSPMISSTPSIFFQLANGESEAGRYPPPPFNQFVKSSILELDNKTENYYNYNGAECPIQTGFDKFFFSFKIIIIMDSQ